MERANASEELAWIRSLMDESQRYLYGTWRHQLVWGVLASAGLTATWLAVRSEVFGAIPAAWGVVLVVGWAYSVFAARRGSERVRNVAGRAFGGIWLALGVTLTLLGVVTIVAGAIDPLALPGIIAIVFGAGYFASGFLAGLRWLSAVGVCWWVGGVALLLWPGPNGILVLATMTLALEVGPALLLRARERSLDAAV